MDSKKIIPFKRVDIKKDRIETENQFPNDPLFTHSYPVSILILNATQKTELKHLRQFELTLEEKDGLKFVRAKTPTAKSYGSDIISLFGYAISLAVSLPSFLPSSLPNSVASSPGASQATRSNLDGFYLGVDNSLHLRMNNAVKGRNLSALAEFRTQAAVSAPLKKFMLDVFANNCLSRAGFALAEGTVPQTLTTAQFLQLRQQFIASATAAPTLKKSVG